MKNKVLTVELSSESVDAQRYFYGTLSLPASFHEIRDAYQKARYDENADRFQDIRIVDCPLLPQLENLRLDAPTVKELEFFANRVDSLPLEELIALKAVFHQYLEKDKLGEIVTMKDLINMTYGLDEVMVAANVGSDEELGQFVIENDLHRDVSAIPDDSLYLLDKARVGQLQRTADKGVYVDGFYVITGDYEMPEVYDGQTLPEQLHDTWYAFRLKIAEPSIASPGDTEDTAQWIRLPISKAYADELAKAHREERIEDCALYGFESSIPQITDAHFWNMEEFQKLNRLAYMLVQMQPEDNAKFKAALELEQPEDMDGVLDIAEHLSEYDFSSQLDDEESFFKANLRCFLAPEFDPRWLDDFPCQTEGEEMLKKVGGMVTDYGIISGRDRYLIELVPRYEEPDQEEGISEADSAFVKTISQDDLRGMKDQEGLILMGCGGSLKDWVDGINEMFTREGMLLNGTKFHDCAVFHYNKMTCILYPFHDDVDLNIGKLAVWRIRTHENFGGTWLSDFRTNQLGEADDGSEDPEEDEDESEDEDEDESPVLRM